MKKYRKRLDLPLKDNLKYKTILLTGGEGFLGNHLLGSLILKKVKKVIIIDNLFNGNLENLAHAKNSKKLKIFIKDVSKYSILEKLFFKYKIYIALNCATKTLNYSFINPKHAFIVRPFNSYGPIQNIKNYLSGAIPSAVKKILLNFKVEIHGSGNQSRDFIYVGM